MILKGSLFQNKKIQKMFESEGYTHKELKYSLWNGGPIESRKIEGVKYIIRGGKIIILETRQSNNFNTLKKNIL